MSSSFFLGIFDDLDKAMHDSNTYIYCSDAFVSATHHGKTYQEETGKTPSSVKGYREMWNLITHAWEPVEDPICPPEALGSSYLGVRDIIVLCGNNLNSAVDPELIRNRKEPIHHHWRASLNILSRTWMGILLHETFHTVDEDSMFYLVLS